MKRIGSVIVDTNGDQVPETLLPGTSNFLPGVSPSRFTLYKLGEEEMVCHRENFEQHCYYP